MLNKQDAKYLAMGALVACMGFTSCIDDKYDLDNVDMTLGSDVDLNLPACSTGDILLTNIIDLEEDGIVQLVDNPNGDGEMYVVCEDGSANIDPINIGEIKIDQPKLGNFDSFVNLIPNNNSAPAHRVARSAAPRNIDIHVAGRNISIEGKYEYELGDDEAVTDIKDAVAADVSSDICALELVKFTENSITLELRINDVPDHFGNLHLDDFRLSLPKELHLTKCTLSGYDDPSVKTEDLKIVGASQIIQLTPIEDTHGHPMGSSLYLTLGFDEASIFTSTEGKPATAANNVVLDAEKHTLSFTGSLSVKGKFRVEVDEMDKEKLELALENELSNMTPEEVNEFTNNKDLTQFSSIIPTSLRFTGANKFANDIVITNVTGDFKHSVDAIDPIKLENLPDFMNDDDVVLDLDNPMIFISTSTNLPVDATTAITLKSIKNNQTIERHTRGVSLKGNKVFWLANRYSEEEMYVPRDEMGKPKYFKPEYVQLYEWDDQHLLELEKDSAVTDLIRMVPKQINIELDEVRLHADDLKLGQPYNVDVKYEIYAPLVFGEEFKLVYQDSETDFDLGDDIDDLTFSNDAVIELTAEVTSTMPTKCTFTVTPLDKNGNVLGILNPVVLSVGAKAQNAPIKAKITPTTGHTINEVLHSGPNQLDGINYKAVLDEPVPNEGLTDSGSIVVKNIKLHVKSKVAYDAN